jgi:hypothetical protein
MLRNVLKNKTPHYKALESADEAWEATKLDLSKLEDLLAALLANQLVGVHEQAMGKKPGA